MDERVGKCMRLCHRSVFAIQPKPHGPLLHNYAAKHTTLSELEVLELLALVRLGLLLLLARLVVVRVGGGG
jgi:hypothetical protein